MHDQTFRLVQSEPLPDSNMGTRTFESHAGDSQPISVDSDGQVVYASTAYWILGFAMVAIVVVAFAFRRPGQKVV